MDKYFVEKNMGNPVSITVRFESSFLYGRERAESRERSSRVRAVAQFSIHK